MNVSKFLCFSLAILLVPGSVRSQSITPSEAETIAEFLYLDNVLSEEGKEELKFRIREGWLRMPRGSRRVVWQDDGTVSNARLLEFLTEQYGSAYAHRQGIGIQMELLRNEEDGFSSDRTAEQDSLLDIEVQKQLDQQVGYQFEQQLARQRGDTIANSWDLWWFFPGLQGPPSDRFIPLGRSVFGYDVRQTLASLRTQSIISEETYAASMANLALKGLLPDHVILQRLADAAADLETTNFRIAQRSLALHWLKDKQLVGATQIDSLLTDSTFLASVDEKDMYPLVEPHLRVRLSENHTVPEVSELLSVTLCDYDSLFCELMVNVNVEPLSGKQLGDSLFSFNATYHGQPIYTGDQLLSPAANRLLLSYLEGYPTELLLAPYNAFLDTLNANYRIYSTYPTTYDGVEEQRDLLIFPLGSRRARDLSAVEIVRVQKRLQGPDADNFLSPAEAINIVDSLTELGFFTTLTQQEYDLGLAQLKGKTLRGAVELFECFPPLVKAFGEGDNIGDPAATNPLPELTGGYYFLFPPSATDRRRIFLRTSKGVADYLSDLFQHNFRKL